MKAASWTVVVIGLVLGVVAGTTYAWKIDPVAYVNTAPGSLRPDFQALYLSLIASAYVGNPDLDRARARLALLPEPNPAETLAALAQQLLAAGRPAAEARAMARLASDLGGATNAPVLTAPPGTTPAALQTRSPTRTAPPALTRTPTATPGAPFTLASQEQVCHPDLAGPLLQVRVFDAAGRPVPGVEVLVVWDQGQDHFFTGLKPELGLGYGDFSMQEGVSYTLQLVPSEDLATGLTAEDCVAPDGSLFPGSWSLTFVQP